MRELADNSRSAITFSRTGNFGPEVILQPHQLLVMVLSTSIRQIIVSTTGMALLGLKLWLEQLEQRAHLDQQGQREQQDQPETPVQQGLLEPRAQQGGLDRLAQPDQLE